MCLPLLQPPKGLLLAELRMLSFLERQRQMRAQVRCAVCLLPCRGQLGIGGSSHGRVLGSAATC